MSGDPSHSQPQTRRSESPALQEWYVVTDGGASAFRMTPGLTVGESDFGVLALNDPELRNQWVEFVLGDHGEPWATVVSRGKSLRVADATCLRHPLQVGAMVRLPHNTLHISRDIRTPRLSGTVVEVVDRDIPHLLQDLVGPEWEDALAAVREPHPGTPAVAIPEPFDSTGPAPCNAETPLEPNRGARDDWSDIPLTMTEPQQRTRRPQSAARQRQVTVLAAMLGLGAGALVGVVAVLMSMGEGETVRLGNFDPVPVVAPPIGPSAEMPVPVESSGDPSQLVVEPVPAPMQAVDGASGAQTPSGGATTTDSRSPPAADAIPPSELAASTNQEGEQVAMLPPAEPELPAPVVLPPVERRSAPPVGRTVTQTVDAAEVAAGPETIDSQPDASVVAELEEIGLMAQAVGSELTRRRDLRAANLALAQGRLTSPPERSAYALYNRVLTQDPGSPEATGGLQSVREGLINRALAQLAGGELDGARRTLQAAAGAGVDPELIADLRNEVDSR